MALVGVAVAAVTITARALEAAADARARTIADAVARAWRAELVEGDAPALAAREAMESVSDRGVQLWLSSDVGRWSSPGGAAVAPAPRIGGACVDAGGAGDDGWRACAASAGLAPADMVVVAAVRTDERRSVLANLVAWMTAFVALAFAAAFAATRFAVRGPTRSFAALARWSERVAAGEPAPVPAGDTVEMDRLAASIEALVKQLVEALERERTSSAHIAHELRTPLTAMRAELDALSAGDPASAAAAERLRGDVARLRDVIDAVLVLSEPAGTPRADTVVNVADVARTAAPSGVEVVAPDEALVDADPRLVELAVANLLDNATKYADGGPRQIRVTLEAEAVRVGVVDDGPGLDASARARVFERYWRGGVGEGTGLGLALVRAVAERHGGRADARPATSSGRGLDVGFSMAPVLAWHAAPAAEPSR